MELLTPPGHGGIAVVAARGDHERIGLLACLCRRDGGPLQIAAGDPPRLAQLHLDGGVRDEVLVVDRGARGLEVHLHGSPLLVEALAARFGPLQPPAPGPAEALLRAALSEAQLDLALEQQDVDFAAFLAGLQALAPAARTAALASALRRSEVARALVEPLRLVLVGRQNAGKSTLLNRLLLQERVLTGPLPGLTRDPVAVATALDGYPFELVDTAGAGPTGGDLDARAQRLGLGQRTAGSAVLLVVDGSRPVDGGPLGIDPQLAADALLVVATHRDLPAAPWPAELPCHLRLDLRDPAAAGAVRLSVGEALRRRRGLPPAGAVGGPAALTAADRAALQRLASAGGPAPA